MLRLPSTPADEGGRFGNAVVVRSTAAHEEKTWCVTWTSLGELWRSPPRWPSRGPAAAAAGVAVVAAVAVRVAAVAAVVAAAAVGRSREQAEAPAARSEARVAGARLAGSVAA